MGIIRLVGLACDGCQVVHDYHPDGHGVRHLRKQAKAKDGWIKKGNKDYCPDCKGKVS